MTFLEVAGDGVSRILELVQLDHRRAASAAVEELTYLLYEAEEERLPLIADIVRQGLAAARRWEAGDDVAAARLDVVRMIVALARALRIGLP